MARVDNAAARIKAIMPIQRLVGVGEKWSKVQIMAENDSLAPCVRRGRLVAIWIRCETEDRFCDQEKQHCEKE